MRNLNIYVEGGSKVLYLDEAIRDPSTMTLRHATVFWRYRNITKNNNSVVYGGNEVTLTPGYWDFEAIRERLSSENIVLSRNIPDRTCNILSKLKPVNLKNLGPILGFPRDTTVPADTQTKSPGPVDVLRGLRYLTVECDAVDIRKSTDSEGERSEILAVLPIVSYEALNSSATNYLDVNSRVEMCSGDLSRVRFFIRSNIPNNVQVDADVLLSIVVE